MFLYKVKLNNKEIKIKPYNTNKEKDLLIMSSFEVYDLDETLSMLELSDDIISNLSENEKKVLLYKFRSISLGDEKNIGFKCSCGFKNETVILCDDFIKPSKLNDSDIFKIDKKITDNNIRDFLIDKSFDPYELNIDEFEKLKQRIKDNQNIFDFTKKVKCLKCSNEYIYDISEIQYIIESLSEDTLMSIYRTYNDLIFFGNYTKQDIDTLYPFERTILIGLLNKTKEDLKG